MFSIRNVVRFLEDNRARFSPKRFDETIGLARSMADKKGLFDNHTAELIFDDLVNIFNNALVADIEHASIILEDLGRSPKPNINIPNDNSYPDNSVQCDDCGGLGCDQCKDRGWLTPRIRRFCGNCVCEMPIHPASVSIYCSVDCAIVDARKKP